MSPPGRKTASEKKPFQRKRKINRDHHPQPGQMATIKDITLTRPTTAPSDTNLGLYSSMSRMPEIRGMMKVENIIRHTIIVYPVIVISKKSSLILGFLKR